MDKKTHSQSKEKERFIPKKIVISGTVMVALMVVFLIMLRLLYPDADWPTLTKDCDPGIRYQEKSFNFKSANKLINLQLSAEDKAVRQVSDLLQIYLHEAANLCDLKKRGELTTDEYINQRSRVTSYFSKLISITKYFHSGKQTESEFRKFLADLERSSLDSSAPTITMSVKVFSDDNQILTNGSILKSGDRFWLDLEVRKNTYLYVLLLDSRGRYQRLYPSEPGGSQNPVSGSLRIPSDPGIMIELDAHKGIEHIYIFARNSRSELIEKDIGEAGYSPLVKSIAKRGAFFSKIKKPAVAAQGDLIVSEFGQAAFEFIIDHR